MLLKSRISDIKMCEGAEYTERWKRERLGKFTASRMVELMGERGLGETGKTYIDTRVFEELAGISTEKDILNESIVHGLIHEVDALRKFGNVMGLDFIATQVLVNSENPKFSCTPDGLITRKESPDGLYYDVDTVETKCYQAAMHMKCAQCVTPMDLKEVDKKAYWQVLSQMDIVDCLNGYAVYYSPYLKLEEGGMRIIHFRKMHKETVNGKTFYPIVDDLRLLQERKDLALKKFEEIKQKIKQNHSK